VQATGDDDVRVPIVLLGLLAVGVTLWLLRDTLIPFAVALLLSYILRPAVVVLSRLLVYLSTCCNAHCALTCQKRTAVWCSTHCSCTALGRRWRGTPPPSSAASRGAFDRGGETETDADDATPLMRDDAVAADKVGATTAVVVLKAHNGGSEPSPMAGSRSPTPGVDAGADGDGNVDFYYVRCTRLTAVLLTTALAVGLLAILVIVIADSVQNFQEQYWDVFSKQFEAVMRRFVDWMRRNLHVDASSLLTIADTLAKEFTASATLMGIASAAVAVVVTLLLMMFLLLDERFDTDGDDDSRERTPTPPGPHQRTLSRTSSWARLVTARATMWRDIDDAIHRYIVAKTTVSAAMGFLVFIVLGPMLHVKLAHLFGVLTFFLNFIPNLVRRSTPHHTAQHTPHMTRAPIPASTCVLRYCLVFSRRVRSSPRWRRCPSSCWIRSCSRCHKPPPSLSRSSSTL